MIYLKILKCGSMEGIWKFYRAETSEQHKEELKTDTGRCFHETINDSAHIYKLPKSQICFKA